LARDHQRRRRDRAQPVAETEAILGLDDDDEVARVR